MLERDLPPDWKAPDMSTIAYRDFAIQGSVDQRRGLDYLATRQDIDMNKIVCMGLSAGGNDLPLLAVEERFKGTLLLSAGIGNWWTEQKVIAEAFPANFAPYIKGPKLMIHGIYDEGIPFRTAAKPLFEILSEPKKLIQLKTGHFPPMDLWVPPALEWLDTVLGPVQKERRARAESESQKMPQAPIVLTVRLRSLALGSPPSALRFFSDCVTLFELGSRIFLSASLQFCQNPAVICMNGYPMVVESCPVTALTRGASIRSRRWVSVDGQMVGINPRKMVFVGRLHRVHRVYGVKVVSIWRGPAPATIDPNLTPAARWGRPNMRQTPANDSTPVPGDSAK